MSIALKVFCVGITFGGASGLASMIPTVKFGKNSSLTTETQDRMLWRGDGKTWVCFIYEDKSKREQNVSTEKETYQLLFWFSEDLRDPDKSTRKCGNSTHLETKGFWQVELDKELLDAWVVEAEKKSTYEKGKVKENLDKVRGAWKIEGMRALKQNSTELQLLVSKNIDEKNNNWTWIAG